MKRLNFGCFSTALAFVAGFLLGAARRRDLPTYASELAEAHRVTAEALKVARHDSPERERIPDTRHGEKTDGGVYPRRGRHRAAGR